MSSLHVIDSHTEGEPTRVLLDGELDFGSGPLAERVRRFAPAIDRLRRRLIDEPRGSEAMVGVLPCEPEDPGCAVAAIFVNNVGLLPMCGHATLGLAVTLAHLGRLEPGKHRVETSAGVVEVQLHDRHTATLENVPSFRHASATELEVPGLGRVAGDVAWGGNWFFIVERPPVSLDPANLPALRDAAGHIRRTLVREGVTGAAGATIDHVALLGPPRERGADACNFVLCPGGAHDRSPCGTGTSAWLACLAASGRLAAGEPWVQDSVLGGRFHASYRPGTGGRIVPSIRGRAFVYGETVLHCESADPLCPA